VARIELITHVSAPPERCFDLARSVDLHTHSTAATGERAVGGVTRGLLGPGQEVTWRARHFGVWQTLTSRITEYDRPRYFRDTMVRGAFRRFDHDHHFEPDGGGGTLMRDVFDYAAPLGPLGRLAEWLFLTRYMRRFLAERSRQVKTAAESADWTRYVAAV
jgi:ligand-binding SRPBCC domain-containing protein